MLARNFSRLSTTATAAATTSLTFLLSCSLLPPLKFKNAKLQDIPGIMLAGGLVWSLHTPLLIDSFYLLAFTHIQVFPYIEIAVLANVMLRFLNPRKTRLQKFIDNVGKDSEGSQRN